MKRLLPVLLLLGCPEPSEEGNGPPPDMGGGQPPGGAPPPGDGTAPPPPGDGTAAPNAGPADGTTGSAIPALTVNPGEGVKLSGTVTIEGNAPGDLRLDLGVASTEGAGQKIIHAVTLPKAGPWEIEVPKDIGPVTLTLFVDANGDGPSPTEPSATIENVDIKSAPITGLDATLKGTAETTPPPADGATAPPADGSAPPAGGTAPPADGAAPAEGGAAPPAPQ